MEAKQKRLVRWAVLLPVTFAGAWLAYRIGGLLLDSVLSGSLGIVRLLIAAYAALAAGYLFSAGTTRLAPGRRYTVAVGLVFVTLAVAAALMLRESDAASPLPAVFLGTSLVVGAFGYALRVRGFTEAISARDG